MMRILCMGLAALSLVPTLASAANLVRPPAAQILAAHGDRRIGTYVSSDRGFATSSYWIEGPDGLVLIDTQFLPSAAEEMVDWAEQATGKKAVLAIVLHPNPDKFNGTAVMQKRGIRVVTSDAVLAAIPAVHELRKGWFYKSFAPDYPSETPKPVSFGAKTQTIRAAGLDLKVHVLGAGCSAAHVVVEFDGHVFPGDLVTNDFHSWLELGKIDAWLERIAELKAMDPEYVHPGRGPSGDQGLLLMEEAYLRKVKEIVTAEKSRVGTGPLSDDRKEAAIERVLGTIKATYPGYRYTLFASRGLPVIWDMVTVNSKKR